MIAMHKVMFSLEYLDINFTLNNNKNREQKRNHRKELSMYVARSAWKSAKFITETVIENARQNTCIKGCRFVMKDSATCFSYCINTRYTNLFKTCH